MLVELGFLCTFILLYFLKPFLSHNFTRHSNPTNHHGYGGPSTVPHQYNPPIPTQHPMMQGGYPQFPQQSFAYNTPNPMMMPPAFQNNFNANYSGYFG